MIKEIEVAELVTYMIHRKGMECGTFEFSRLRKIGDYIERKDISYRVVLNEGSLQAFRNRSTRNIIVHESALEVRGAKSQMMMAIFNQYLPSENLSKLMEEAIEKTK